MADTMTGKERLCDLQARLPDAERNAAAEKAFAAASTENNPWQGASETLATLQHAIANEALAEQGRKLIVARDRLHALDAEIEKSAQDRERADRLTAELAADESVIRFQKARFECMRRGFAYSWELFVPWFLSGRPKHQGLTDQTAFFVNDATCPPELQFSETERAKIIQWHLAKGESVKALTIWDAQVQLRRDLLREHPELGAVA